MLDAHAPEMPARVDEGGLEVGRLTTPDGTAELRQDILVCFTGQNVGDLSTEQLGIQFPGGSLRRGVYVHEPAIDVVQARGHDKPVDQPEVDGLQEIGHDVPMVNRRSPWVNGSPPDKRPRRDTHTLTVRECPSTECHRDALGVVRRPCAMHHRPCRSVGAATIYRRYSEPALSP